VKKYSLEIVATQKKRDEMKEKRRENSQLECLRGLLNSESTKGFHLKLIIKLVFIISVGLLCLKKKEKKENGRRFSAKEITILVF
jgi:hypothetical protein